MTLCTRSLAEFSDLAQAAQQVSPVPSPCINICRMDAATGYCEGCLRTIDEIVAWGGADDATRRAIWAQLPGRLRWVREPAS
ncbi:DUF1289 domain-containing protein [Cupriavidus plantarum]|uniref:Fe-S protein YdhL (DUF1289 family) n=1 Tax=Cupriavidus plantarum TaxID=942865 RepID=A0A316F406_9BURK|nr:DUF1289 domain-containing protein [Cupriavidus plantarum]NYH97605.1 hypothetical protein [Cupriavidus plantarum]PWK38795.1 hypothetical protein C7419_1012697 [Cupriavidus plantarum]REE92424.1 hypothetical protein C7418_3691 [Cupriavidus plantarum]RLK35973.1 hypothetical protein C7417_3747 [Cupriavidus plantarum]CAG2126694.1 hypothetical protein LMG26296_00062 [Cupriavidus plantarum]